MSDILRYLTPSVHVSSSSTSWHYGELQGRPPILHFRYKQRPKIMLNLLWNIFKFEIKLMTFSNSVAFLFKHLQQVKSWKQCHDHRKMTSYKSNEPLTVIFSIFPENAHSAWFCLHTSKVHNFYDNAHVPCISWIL